MSDRYHYPLSALSPDLARAAGGIAVTAGPMPWLADAPVALFILGALAVAFAAFGVTTLVRRATVVEVGAAGISTSGPRRATVAWDEMTGFDLRYFSTRRDREKGWMQLRVSGGGGKVHVDSALDGFGEVVGRVASVAQRRGLDPDETTAANLQAAGIRADRRGGRDAAPA